MTDTTNTTPAYQTRRLRLNYHSFSQSPVATIKQLLSPNTQIISYKLNSVIPWDGQVIVDVVYSQITIDPFTTHYIPISEIKHLIPNSEKYVASINNCKVKLNNPKLNNFKDYLPVKIKKSLINTTDVYDKYYAQLDDEEFVLSTPSATSSEPIPYYGTTPSQPMNAFCAPLTLLTKVLSNINEVSLGFNIELPKKLYPDSFKPKFISSDECLQYYKQLLVKTKLLQNVDDVKIEPKLDFSNVSMTSTTAYLISVEQLPNSSPIHGIILLQPKRIPDIILYYPTNAYEISIDEIESIKRFIEFDKINYYNYYYLKK